LAVTLKVDDEKVMLADIERVRGDLTPGEFIVKCIRAGVRLADLERRKKAEAGKSGVLNLGEVAPKFAKLDRDAVMAAMIEVNEKLKYVTVNNSIYDEVRRLVVQYTAMVERHRKETGLPIGNVEAVALAPIQQIALEVALNSTQGNPSRIIKTATKH